jgi:hypothetical protein
MFGSISNVADIDVFFCADTNASAQASAKVSGVFMQSINSQDSFYIIDSLSRVFSLGNQIKPIDTIFITDSMAKPLYVFVVSRIKGSEGDYELGIVTK